MMTGGGHATCASTTGTTACGPLHTDTHVRTRLKGSAKNEMKCPPLKEEEDGGGSKQER